MKYHVTDDDVRDALNAALGDLSPTVLPGLLASILVNERHVKNRRMREILAERFGAVPPVCELIEQDETAREQLEVALQRRFGFLPRYQVRWLRI